MARARTHVEPIDDARAVAEHRARILELAMPGNAAGAAKTLVIH